MSQPPLASALGLQPHPEGGWFRETYRSEHTVTRTGEQRSAATLIHYLLEPGDSSAWHTVASDEIWLWHLGGPLELLLGAEGERPSETTERIILGPHLNEGHALQALVPARIWQTARPATDEAVLVSCMVCPGFDFADFQMDEPAIDTGRGP